MMISPDHSVIKFQQPFISIVLIFSQTNNRINVGIYKVYSHRLYELKNLNL